MWDYQSAAVRQFFMLEATRRRCVTDVPDRPLVDPVGYSLLTELLARRRQGV